MDYKKLIQTLGFTPKENTVGIFQKKYSKCDNYAIEIDFENSTFNFGNKIQSDSKTTQNFSQTENWVVLECVDRLLEKGYQPQNLILEKTWKTGHNTSGRLDILVTNDDGSAYLMIECKTWGAEFDKEFKKLEKDGGQLFTYFQQDKNADILMLYTSQLQGDSIEFKNTIVKIEEDYRQTGNVKDFFERWNKLPKFNGIFDNWAAPYDFKSKALTKNDLKILKQEDSSFIFNRFLEILRHNVVSDKPNAFNKIFTLFLCKIVDEYSKDNDEKLDFQWLEGKDNHTSFQKRLTDLYRKGMKDFLEKKVTDVSDDEFDVRFQQVDEKYREEIKEILTTIRLKKNNEFAIKEVYDDASFEENAKVVKEVVELLQVYQIRYNYRQQFLSDFFELLLTTGLKQESGQFFTPVPIARFIIKSLPFHEISAKKIEQGNKNDLLPTIIDYAAGSGHFLTESMEEVQKYIDKLDLKNYKPETRKQLDGFQRVQFDWAEKYVYGIEKDYRLVKTAKVSCYLHGDGLAKVIHGDGLGDFASSKDFKDLLKETDKTYSQDNKQFDIIISNPPYSVSAFKGTMMESDKAQKAFNLYHRLTDQSSEIECLFIERSKQLLKDGGVAGIILPSSILSNTGIYTQAREILLKHFEILGIAELGSNTFMATGTNTVTLFLRRRNNADAYNVEEAIKKCFVSLQDITINGIEKPLSKYVSHVWDSISLEDYKTLLQKTPNDNIKQHEICKEYIKKIQAKAKDEQELWNNILALEQDKLLYFILAYPQKLVLVKTGEKDAEKRFLGYEFSNRRGSEGIHPIQRSKSIDECTQLYDVDSFTNPEKASTYIYKAFLGQYDLELPEVLQQNISYHNLVDMLCFDRVDFEKNISLSAKKKVIIQSKYPQEKVENVFEEIKNGKNVTQLDLNGRYRVSRIETIADATFNINATKWTNDDVSENDFLQKGDILLSHINSVSHLGKTAFFNLDEQVVHGVNLLKFRPNQKLVIPKYISEIFKINLFIAEMQKHAIKAANQASINATNIKNLKIPLPPLEIQQKIVSEIEALEVQEQKAVEEIKELKEEINISINNLLNKSYKIENLERLTSLITKGSSPTWQGITYTESPEVLFVTSENVREGYLDFSKKKYLENKFNEIQKRSILEKNDVLINIVGASIGRSAVFNLNVSANINQAVALVRCKPELLDYQFLNFFLNSEKVISEYTSMKKEVARANLSLQNIADIKIPLPPISDQQKIVSEIEKLEAKIAKLEEQISDIPKQKEKILKKYLE